jgi:two-component system, chemotaxis family, sensor kinase CheA
MQENPSEKEYIKILLIDDEPDLLESLNNLFQKSNFTILSSSSPAQAIELIKTHSSDLALVISDFKMPEMTGFEIRKQMLPNLKDIPFFILSAYISREMALEGIEYKISAFIEKPYSEQHILEITEKETKTRIVQIREEHELLGTFVKDCEDLLEEYEQLALSLESTPSDLDSLNRIFGIIHTIKGSSSFFKPDILYKFAHKLEDSLSPVKTGVIPVTSPVVTSLLKACDILKSLLNEMRTKQYHPWNIQELLSQIEIQNNKAVPATQQQDLGQIEPKKKTVTSQKNELRVSTLVLDDFMELSGEITVIRNMVKKITKSLEKQFSGNRDITLLGDLLEQMNKINSQMQDKVADLRKVPMKNIYRPLQRTIHDLSINLKKEIDLITEGDELRIDAAIAETLSNSLIHMIRNSADHGLETPEQREQAGKPKQGTITLKSYEKGENVVVEISDNGRGIDTEKIRAKIVEKGMFSQAEANAMNQQRLMNMIFESGLSTAAKVTDISGRGVGMDMVRVSVEKAGGRIDIQSEFGKGTTFAIQLPIPKSVLIINSLLVECGGQHFAIPQDNIVSIEPAKVQSQIGQMEGGWVIRFEDHLVPLVYLAQILNKIEIGQNFDSPINIIVVRAKSCHYGIVVDTIIDIEDTVVKSISKEIPGAEIFSGATFLGDGKVSLILDIESLAYRSQISGRISQMKTSQENLSQQNGESNDHQNFLTFKLNNGNIFATLLSDIYRLETLSVQDLQKSGAKTVTLYRGQIIPFLSVSKYLNQENSENRPSRSPEKIPTLITQWKERFIAFEVSQIVDIAIATSPIIPYIKDRIGLAGNIFVGDKTLSVVDLTAIAESTERDYV